MARPISRSVPVKMNSRPFKTTELTIKSDNPLTNLVARGRSLHVLTWRRIKNTAYRDTCIDQFDHLDATIAVPLLHNNKSLGVLFLGDKMSGKFFNKQDIDLVKMLSARGAVAIDNAQSGRENAQRRAGAQ